MQFKACLNVEFDNTAPFQCLQRGVVVSVAIGDISQVSIFTRRGPRLAFISVEGDIHTLSSRSPQFLGGELKKTTDEKLFLELALRGYDLSKLRDEPTTPEIVKIG